MDAQDIASGDPQDEGIGGTPGPPTAATPPFSCAGDGDDLKSLSICPESGARLFSTSGMSLGEAFRHNASEGMESWYQLPAEVDYSYFPAASVTRLENTGQENDQTEIPTLEEGPLTQSVDPGGNLSSGQTRSGPLEMQHQRLPPHLHFLPSHSAVEQMRIFDDTFLQQNELEFVPVRWSPDVSEFSELHSRRLLIQDAILLASTEVSTDLSSGCVSLSQHPILLSNIGAGDASSPLFLSEHSLPSISKSENVTFGALGLRAETYSEHVNPPEDASTVVQSSSIQSPLLLSEHPLPHSSLSENVTFGACGTRAETYSELVHPSEDLEAQDSSTQTVTHGDLQRSEMGPADDRKLGMHHTQPEGRGVQWESADEAVLNEHERWTLAAGVFNKRDAQPAIEGTSDKLEVEIISGQNEAQPAVEDVLEEHKMRPAVEGILDGHRMNPKVEGLLKQYETRPAAEGLLHKNETRPASEGDLDKTEELAQLERALSKGEIQPADEGVSGQHEILPAVEGDLEVPDEQSAAEGFLDFITHDGSFLDSSVSAPMLLELLEKEVGLSSSGGSASGSNSSFKMFLGTQPENKQLHQAEDVGDMEHEGDYLGPDFHEVVINQSELELLEKEAGLSSSGRSSLNSSCYMMFSSTVPENQHEQQVQNLGTAEQVTMHMDNNQNTTELLKTEVELSSSGRSSLDSSYQTLSSILSAKKSEHQLEPFTSKEQEISQEQLQAKMSRENRMHWPKNVESLETPDSPYSRFLAVVAEKEQMQPFRDLCFPEQATPYQKEMQEFGNVAQVQETRHGISSAAVAEKKKQMQPDGNLRSKVQETAYEMFSAIVAEKNDMQQSWISNPAAAEAPYKTSTEVDKNIQMHQDRNLSMLEQETPSSMSSSVVTEKSQVPQVSNVSLGVQEAVSLRDSTLFSQCEENTSPRIDLSKPSSDVQLSKPLDASTEKEKFPALSSNSVKLIEFIHVDMSDCGQSDLSALIARPLNKQKQGNLQDDLRQKLFSEMQSKAEERKSNASPQSALVGSENARTGSWKKGPLGEALRAELTVSSGCSIERGHESAEMSSPDAPPLNDSPLFREMTQPVSQSTPATFPSRSLKKEIASKMVPFMSNLPGPRDHDDPCESSKGFFVTSSGKERTEKIVSETNSESSESQSTYSPPSGRIQSLPTLSYMEKVGAWNVNQPLEKRSFDALVLRGFDGVSPKKKAYSAVAESLNRMLTRHSNSSSPKRSLAASFAGTSSLTSLNSEDRRAVRDLPLTRSQSDNVISSVSEETTRTEVVLEKGQKSIEQPLEEQEDEKCGKGDALKLEKKDTSDSKEQIRTSSLDHSGCSSLATVGRKSLEATVPMSGQKVFNVLPNKEDSNNREVNDSLQQSPDPNNTTTKFTMEPFSDISLNSDSNYLGSSQSNAHIDHTLAGSTGAASGQSLTSLEVDNYAPYWSPAAKTPEKKELNIEERIPTYLRNLGIEQSPSTILNPFAPRGPIREPEFSPSELRTFKGSDSTTKSIRCSEGVRRVTGAALASLEISPSSRYSGISTMSTSIPMGSDCGPDTPLPTEHSPSFMLRSSNERPIGQYSILSHPSERQLKLSEARSTEHISQIPLTATEDTPVAKSDKTSVKSASESNPKAERFVIGSGAEELDYRSLAIPPPRPSKGDDESPSIVLKRVQGLVDKFESGVAARHFDSLSSSPIMEDSLELDRSREPLSSTYNASLNQQTKDPVNDSFVGSNTLKEIRQLLAEADNIYLEVSNPESPLVSLGDSHEDSLVLWRNGNNSPASEALRRRTERHSPSLQRKLSLDASLNSSLTSEAPIVKSISLPHGFLHRENISSVDQRNHGKYTKQRYDARNSISEPQERVVQSWASKVVKRAEPEGATNTTVARKIPLAGSGHSSAKNVSSDPSCRTTELLSSVSDALSGLEQALVMSDIGSIAKGPAVLDSDGSSSADSLAARVNSLLKREAPVRSAKQLMQRSQEEEKTCALLKLKLTDQRSDVQDILNAEDRRRIEEIKAELLESAKKAGSTKNSGLMSSDSDSLSQLHDVDRFSDLLLEQPPNDTQAQGVQEQEARMISIGQLWPGPGTLHEAERPLRTMFSLPSRSLSDDPVEPTNTRGSVSRGEVMNHGLKATTSATDDQTEKKRVPPQQPSEEATQPITSITFSSRKLTPSPSSSPSLITSLTYDAPTTVLPLEIRPISTDIKGIDSKHTGIPERYTSENQTPCPADNGYTSIVNKGRLPQHSAVQSKHEVNQSKTSFLRPDTEQPDAEQGQSSYSQRDVQRRTLPLGQESRDMVSARPLDSGGVSRSTLSTQEPLTTSTIAGHVPSISSFVEPSLLRRSSPTNIGSDTGNASIATTPVTKDQGVFVTDGKVQVSSLSQNRRLEGRSEPSYNDLSTVSSPKRKALSCVRVTIAPKASPSKMIEFSLVGKSDTPTASQSRDRAQSNGMFRTDTQERIPYLDPVSMVVREQPVEKNLRFQDDPIVGPSEGSYFLHPSDSGPPNRSRTSIQHNQRQRECNQVDSSTQSMLSLVAQKTSDAMTQITTESPEKTTFSAEIYIQEQKGERSTHSSADKRPAGVGSQVSGSVKIPLSSRPADRPLLIPYRPPGSSEMYYVPYPEDMSRSSPVRSDTTVESTHSGSNDAVPPKFPAEVLGSVDDRDPVNVTIKHQDGIYSRHASPKEAWQDDDIASRTAKEKLQDSSRTAQNSSMSHVLHPQPEHHSETSMTNPPTSIRRSQFQYRDHLRFGSTSKKDHLKSLGYQEEDEGKFFPLKPEVDYGSDLEQDVTLALRHETLDDDDWQRSAHKRIHGRTQKRKYFTDIEKYQTSNLSLKESTASNGSLDELWARFLERQKKHRLQDLRSSSQGEIPLIDRLDRLARLLRNPAAYSLAVTEEEPRSRSIEQRECRKRRQKVGRDGLESALNSSNLVRHISKGYGRDSTPSVRNTVCSKADWVDAASSDNIKQRFKKKQYVFATSESSSSKDDQSSVIDLTIAADSETATQTDSDRATQTETGSTVSTIDTLRLIKAFGPERVYPSSKLSHLYNTIDHQKIRLEGGRKGSRKAVAKEPDNRHFTELPKNIPATQISDMDTPSDTASTVSSSWGPSPALKIKKHVRHKGIQAGDFEIVMSGTKRNTRDVGMTFPSPNPFREIPTRDLPCANGVFSQPKVGKLSEPEDIRGQKKWPNGILTEKISRKIRPTTTGVTWFVPAEDLKSSSRKENQSSPVTGHSPSWYEPLTKTKPWREPLREKNLQEQLIINRMGTGVHTSPLLKDTENRTPSPFVRITLQEALKLRRPEFISSSRERIKRLELIREERKLQSLFQSEREQLFNPPEERINWRGTTYPCTERDAQILQKRRTIPKKEMVERSKRIYEQLPEITKRKEEAKRKSEYMSYRLKAQLYKKKITNHVLGRKTPWD